MHPPFKSPIRLLSALIICALANILWAGECSSSESSACESTSEPTKLSPFVWLENIPDDVDAAAVLNNPAEQFLLNDSGRSIRKLLAMAGIFTHTEHAWDALGNAFDADPDETIQSLLSKRVVIVWDGIESPTQSIAGFANSIDTHWTIICEVDQAYIKDIRTHLKPVRRSIEHGHAVYAIEKGRYKIVLINEERNKEHTTKSPAIVLLAPKSGSSLLINVLGSIVNANPNQQLPTKSIMHNRAHLGVSLADEFTADTDWSIAWMLQLDRINKDLADSLGVCDPDPDKSSLPPNRSPVLAGVINSTPAGMNIGFATDLDLDLPAHDAPVGLLSAVGGDAILAVALAQTPEILVNEHSIEYSYGLGTKPKDPGCTPYLGGPGIILLTELADDQLPAHAPSVGLTMMTELPQLDASDPSTPTPAHRVDQIMHELLSSADPIKAPDFAGRFPNAVRTHTIDTAADAKLEDTQSASKSWPGEHPQFSWLASELSHASAMIATIGPFGTDTAHQVRWIAEAAKNLDAIPHENGPDGVITTGYFKPSRALELIESGSVVDLVLSKLVDRIDWNITRAPIGIQGTLNIELTGRSNQTNLGVSSSR